MRTLMMALALAAVPPAGATGQFYPGAERSWGPNGNGTLEHEDDLRWVFFHDVKITADEAKGIYTATFTPVLAKEDGRPLSITGYMLPIEPTTTSPHFVLTRRSAGCPFCPPNEPTEVIEVFATKPVQYTQAPITVEGTLHLVARSEKGLVFRLSGASAQ